MSRNIAQSGAFVQRASARVTPGTVTCRSGTWRTGAIVGEPGRGWTLMAMRLPGAAERTTSDRTAHAYLAMVERRSTAKERARRTRSALGAALREIRGLRDRLLAEASARLRERFHG